MRSLFDALRRVAPSDIPVHVFGETGTGKEKVARALHELSPRRARPFVALNASSLSDELLEAEMFGHTRGAFTGAVTARAGHVAEAEGGTLFIDEVASLSPRGQTKLLRFLQEREYRRLGETALRRANVRIVSAANADLEREVADGRFRSDLLYRLTGETLKLPPLRERGSDLPELAHRFLAAAARREGVRAPRLGADMIAALAAYAWPGNVRELENEMSRLALHAKDGPVGTGHLSARITAAAPRRTLPEARLAFERDYLGRALERNGGRRARTAEELGITRQALLSKMKRLGLARIIREAARLPNE
jgi:DNA-binding NtrC family response regulator